MRFVPALLAIFALAAFAPSADAAPTAVQTGGYASCYLESGGAYCWTGGSGEYGYPGAHGAPYNSSPTLFPGLTSGVSDIALSSEHGCAVVSGAAKCWGTGYSGQLGDPDFYDKSVAVPVQASGLTSGVTDIAVGEYLSCAVVSGTVKCWGLAVQTTVGQYSHAAATPTAVPQVTGVVTAIEAGDSMACAIASGGVKCWGGGYLGNGADSPNGTIASVTGLGDNVSKISVNGSSACAIRLGVLKCWGAGAGGHSGDGSATPSLSPITPTGLASNVTDVAVGPDVICAVVSGAVRCWGSGRLGQLGDEADSESATPIQVPGLSSGATAVSTAGTVACALVSGTVKCWGDNERGLLGDGVLINSFTPASLPALASGVTDIAAGWSGGCAVVSGAGKCWGNLQLPSSNESNDSFSAASPTTVSGLESGVTDIDVDMDVIHQDSGCATVSGAIKCWRTGTPPTATTLPASPTGATSLSFAGEGCALISGGAQCWGDWEDPDFVPFAGATSGVTQVSTSSFTHCAVVSGAAKCWGSNTWGQLGDGTYNDAALPQIVPGMSSGVTSIATSNSGFTCAAVNGAAKCWGEGESAQLGDGEASDSPTAVQPVGLTSGVTSVAVSLNNACAVKDGDAYCWGAGASGEMGDDNKYGSTIPVKATGLPSTVTQVDSGLEHNCAIAGGGAYCWGANTYGELGTGTTFGLRGPTTTASTDDYPAGGIIRPVHYSDVNQNSVSLEIATANAAEVTCRLDDGVRGPCPSSYTGLPDGGHRIQLTVENADGQFTSDESYFFVDTAAPTVKIISPADGSNVVTDQPALYFEVENSTYYHATCTLDGVTLKDEYGYDECGDLASLPKISTGKHTLVVTAYDSAGNAGSATSSFTYGAVPDTPVKRTPNLSASLIGKPKKSRKSVKVGFQIKFPVGSAELAAGCKGSVRISVRTGKKKKKTIKKSGALKLDGKMCRMKTTITLPRSAVGTRVTFDTYFPGNNVFMPTRSIKKLKIKG